MAAICPMSNNKLLSLSSLEFRQIRDYDVHRGVFRYVRHDSGVRGPKAPQIFHCGCKSNMAAIFSRSKNKLLLF